MGGSNLASFGRASGAYNGLEQIMDLRTDEPIKLMRDCQVVAVPAGHTIILPEGTEVVITQSLGGSYTLMVPTYGGLFRLSARDGDAVGRDVLEGATAGLSQGEPLKGEALETQVWQTLKTCYDPEIPVHIVDLELFRLSARDADAVGREVLEGGTPGLSQGEPLKGEALETQVWQTLKTCYDPEIPVNIVDLGLIYDMHLDQLSDGARVVVKMTLTAQGCGMGTSIAADARNKILDLPGVVEADVQVVWEPPWSPEKISPEGRALLGIH